jgi:hypothetical protein
MALKQHLFALPQSGMLLLDLSSENLIVNAGHLLNRKSKLNSA